MKKKQTNGNSAKPKSMEPIVAIYDGVTLVHKDIPQDLARLLAAIVQNGLEKYTG